MEKKSFWNRFGGYLVALVVFVAISCIYCAPSFEGKVVLAGDTSSGRGSARETVAYHEQTGDYTFWTGSQFCGMPNYQVGGAHYKANDLMKPLKKVLLAGQKAHATPVILLTYFICFFILLRVFRVDTWTSIAGALAIGFSSYFLTIIPAGHLYKTSSIPLLALMAAGFVLLFRKRYGWGVVLTLVPTSVCFVIHPQMTYYVCMMVGLFYLAEVYIHIREKRLKDLGVATLLFALCLAVGLGANSANVFANQEYAEQTMRGGHSDLVKADDATNKTKGLDLDYATQWSYGFTESLSFIVPGIMGGSSNYDVGKESRLYQSMTRQGVDRRAAAQFCQSVPLYWGDQPFTAGNVYMGAIVCFLFLLGAILVKGPYKWALVAATAFSVALAWGNHFMPLTAFFFRWFPMYNKFRAVSSILIVAEIAMPLLGFMAVRDIVNGSHERRRVLRAIYISGGITAGLCLILALFGGSLFSFQSPADGAWQQQLPAFVYQGIVAERRALLVSDAWRSFLFIVAAALVVWLHAKGVLKRTAVTATLLGVLIVADLWPVNKRYFNDGNFVTERQTDAQFAMQPYEQQILADKDIHFRVFNLTTNAFNESRTSYRLKHIGGYNAAKLRRYQDLIDQHISKMNMSVINMLNTKYFIVKGSDGQPQPMRNPDAMGNAWFVDSLVVVDDANAESAALSTLDLHTTAVLDRSFAGHVGNLVPGHDDAAHVRLTSYTPPRLDYECHASRPGTIVFSEVYYPYGWKATLDGQPVDHYRVNYLLRAINVPAGDHAITFVFDPDSVRKGDTLSVICVCIMYATLLALLAIALVRRRKSKEK